MSALAHSPKIPFVISKSPSIKLTVKSSFKPKGKSFYHIGQHIKQRYKSADGYDRQRGICNGFAYIRRFKRVGSVGIGNDIFMFLR